jgi:glycosyltransferase involved in cell wall biosynthesis
MSDRVLHFLVPGDLETKTGGYGYDRAIIAGLRARSWAVHAVSVPGDYPLPSRGDRRAAARVLASVPDNAVVLADGLAFGALPEEVARERQRLRFVVLVHHPLGLETGLDAIVSAELLESERLALHSSRGVVVTSSRTVSAVEALGVDIDRIAIVEPGTAPKPVAAGSAGGRLKLLCVASLIPRKGHDTLLDALTTIVQLSWELTCVGRFERDSDYAANILRRCSEPPLEGRVTLAGELAGATLDAAYDSADLFVLPTRYEGYGMAVAEALAWGIPVVSTATGAIAELVGNGAGVLVPPDDAATLAATLERILTRRVLRARLRDGAIRARASLPSWGAASALMEEALLRFAR